MASRDLLEMLGSGAAFAGKGRRREVEQGYSSAAQTSVNFFGDVTTAGVKKRRQESASPNSVVSNVIPSSPGCRDGGRSRKQSKKDAKASLQLFGKHGGDLSQAEDIVGTTPAGTMAATVRAEQMACFRRQMGIRVKGENVCDPMQTFLDMPHAGTDLDSAQTRRVLLKNVEESAWKEPTPIQMQAVPVLVAGRDLLAAAPTGSGKTAAFVMPIILRLGVGGAGLRGCGLRAILLAPTRELAAQIHRDVVRLSRGRKLRACLLTQAGAAKAASATCGDRNKALSGYDIVVSTPMRLVALLREGAVTMTNVKIVVLDEADKLFDDAGAADGGGDKAFVTQVDEVLAACSHRDVQRALFSATIGHHVSTSG